MILNNLKSVTNPDNKNGENISSMRRRYFVSTIAFYFILMSYGCSYVSGDPVGPPPNPVTVKEILEMTEAGLPSEIIIEKIQESRTVYRLQASQLAQLKEMGVSDDVINYMQQTYIDAVRQDQAYNDLSNFVLADDGFWYGGPFYGGPWW